MANLPVQPVKRRSSRRRPMLLGILLLVGIIVIGGTWYFFIREEDEGVGKPDTVADQQEAADNALAILQDLVTDDNYATLGFRSRDEVKSATLGTPLTLYFVPLDGLQAFDGEGDPNQLLVDSEVVYYPVLVETDVRSSVGIQGGAEEGWTPVSFGTATLMQAVAQNRLTADNFLVQIPSLGLYFVGERSEDGLLLTAVVETGYDLPVGQAVPAADVFRILRDAALNVNTEAPM